MIPFHTDLTPADLHHLEALYGGKVKPVDGGFELVTTVNDKPVRFFAAERDGAA